MRIERERELVDFVKTFGRDIDIKCIINLDLAIYSDKLQGLK